MTTIAGASRFITAATLANSRGIPVQAPTVLSDTNEPTSLLDAGRGISSSGIGLSPSARALNEQLIDNGTTFNQLFSLAIGSAATTEGLQQEILALRASLPVSKLDPSVIEIEDDGGVDTPENGQTVDTTA